LPALIEQMDRDSAQARAILAGLPKAGHPHSLSLTTP
jgi:hypothetical protein